MPILYLLTIIVGMVSSRAIFIAARGGVLPQTIVRGAIGLLCTISTVALLIWGFFNFEWYWPLVAFGLGVIASAVLVTGSTWTIFYATQLFIDVAVVAVALYLFFFSH
jgi:hypothetical protein